MPGLSNEARIEIAAITSRSVLQAIDLNLGNAIDESARTAVLQSVIASGSACKSIRVNGVARKVPHTLLSLQKHIGRGGRLVEHRKDEADEPLEVWTRGSSMFQDDWLRRIGVLAADEVGSTDSASQTQPNGSSPGNQSAQLDKHFAETGERVPQTMKPQDSSNAQRIVHEVPNSSSSSSAQLLELNDAGEDAAQVLGLDEQRRSGSSRRSASAPNLPRVASAPLKCQKTASPSPAPCPSHLEPSKSPKRSASEASLDESGRRKQDRHKAPTSVAELAGAQHIASAHDRSGESPCAISLSDVLDGLRNGNFKVTDIIRESGSSSGISDRTVIAPRRGVRGQHHESMQRRLREATSELFPPEVPEKGIVREEAMKLHDAVQQSVKEGMERGYRHAENFTACYCGLLELDDNVPALFVLSNTSAELEELYQQILGSKEWRAELLQRQNRTKPWTDNAMHVLTSLIAAEIHLKVFTQKQPWDLEHNVKTLLGEDLKYCEEGALDMGYQFDEILKHSAFKMLDDPKFQETVVGKEAKKLATDLALKISPHLLLLRRSQRTAEPSRIGPSDDTTWVDHLHEIFYHALISKGKVQTYNEASWQFFWPKVGAPMVREECHSKLDRNLDQQTMLVLWPGLRKIRKEFSAKGGDGAPEVSYLPEARVLTLNTSN